MAANNRELLSGSSCQLATRGCRYLAWQTKERAVSENGQRRQANCSTSTRPKIKLAIFRLLLMTMLIVITNNNLIISTESGGLQETKTTTTTTSKQRQTGPTWAAITTGGRRRSVRSLGLLMPINELRVSGSKSEPPSRPSVDWSRQRPYFGPNMERNVSVELGKTAYLTCKVYELGDKTVSWLRPRQNEILTAGRYTYISDPRFASINDNGSHDWILEIKDVGLNDSTSYECQVSTDPKMSTIINLQVKASKAKIKQGEQFYASVGANIEFTCETSQQHQHRHQQQQPNVQQTYWYFNGDLLNYARAHSISKNFSIEWDPSTQTSRFKLLNLQLNDAGNYTCKPTSAEPSTIRLHVKKANKSNPKDRSHHSGTGNGYLTASSKDYQRNRQQHAPGFEANSSELADSAANSGVLHSLSLILLAATIATYINLVNLDQMT